MLNAVQDGWPAATPTCSLCQLMMTAVGFSGARSLLMRDTCWCRQTTHRSAQGWGEGDRRESVAYAWTRRGMLITVGDTPACSEPHCVEGVNRAVFAG
jgi:hypothetical protein